MVIFFIKSGRVIGIIYENLLQCLVQPHHQPRLIHRRDKVGRHIINLGQKLMVHVIFHVAVDNGIHILTLQGLQYLGAGIIVYSFIGKSMILCIFVK